MKNLHPYYFQHRQYGYIVEYEEMMEIMHDEYDGGDDTNACEWWEYFFETNMLVYMEVGE